MKKQERNLFNELVQGLNDLAEARVGQKTLCTHEVAARPAPDMTAAENTFGWGMQQALCHAEMLQVPIRGDMA